MMPLDPESKRIAPAIYEEIVGLLIVLALPYYTEG